MRCLCEVISISCNQLVGVFLSCAFAFVLIDASKEEQWGHCLVFSPPLLCPSASGHEPPSSCTLLPTVPSSAALIPPPHTHTHTHTHAHTHTRTCTHKHTHRLHHHFDYTLMFDLFVYYYFCYFFLFRALL